MPAGRIDDRMVGKAAGGYRADMSDTVASSSASNLASNVRRLREARGLSQQQISKVAGIPRPTWASLESGVANPTLAVLARAAAALQVSIEELIGPPRTAARRFAAAELRSRKRQGATIRALLPESIPGLDISRMELEPGGQFGGIPHTAGTREYLTCESGRIELVASGERWELGPGDALVFRGDQRHSYRNLDPRRPALAISVVCFAPAR
jgi:transcriptional regulator with XRE-family HTH domain